MNGKKFLFSVILIALTFFLVACVTPQEKTALHNLVRDEASTPTSIPSTISDNEVDRDTKEVNCPNPNPHPIAEDIAKKFDTPYEDIISWYCEGNSFQDIVLALITSKLWEIDPGVVLSEKMSKSWRDIWQELEDGTK